MSEARELPVIVLELTINIGFVHCIISTVAIPWDSAAVRPWGLPTAKIATVTMTTKRITVVEHTPVRMHADAVRTKRPNRRWRGTKGTRDGLHRDTNPTHGGLGGRCADARGRVANGEAARQRRRGGCGAAGVGMLVRLRV